MHFYFNGFLDDKVKKPSYWMPLDPDIYLPYHHKLNRVPCLFEPFQKGKIFKINCVNFQI